jgi:hypothetical protein
MAARAQGEASTAPLNGASGRKKFGRAKEAPAEKGVRCAHHGRERIQFQFQPHVPPLPALFYIPFHPIPFCSSFRARCVLLLPPFRARHRQPAGAGGEDRHRRPGPGGCRIGSSALCAPSVCSKRQSSPACFFRALRIGFFLFGGDRWSKAGGWFLAPSGSGSWLLYGSEIVGFGCDRE